MGKKILIGIGITAGVAVLSYWIYKKYFSYAGKIEQERNTIRNSNLPESTKKIEIEKVDRKVLTNEKG